MGITGISVDLVLSISVDAVFDFYFWARGFEGATNHHKDIYKVGDASFIENGALFKLFLVIIMLEESE